MSNIIDSIQLSGVTYTLQGSGGGTVDSAITSGSTNPVENQALWDELRIPKNEEVETVLEWENNDGGATTNYPTGASKLEFYIDENEMTEGYFYFKDDGYNELGKIFIEISNGNISVTDYENVTYTISGDVVTVNYSSIAASVVLIYSSYDCNWTVKAYTGGIVYEPIIDQVSANTAAISGKVDTSAITSSVTSASTDSEIPTAKAVFDAIPTGSTSGNPTVELTQAQYDALVSAGTVDPNTFYVITDATPVDVSQYWTSAQTQSAITQATSGKVNTSSVVSSVTSASTDSEIPTAKAVWEAASGGGTTYTAGRGIDITSDTISVSLPISAGTGTYSIAEGQSTRAMSLGDHAEGCRTYANGGTYAAHAEGYQTSAMTAASHAEGRGTKTSGYCSHAEGLGTQANEDYSHAEGEGTIASASRSHAEGYYTSATSVSNVSGIQPSNGFQARHSEGAFTLANNASTHVEGYFTVANNFGEHASGVFNNSSSATTTYGDSGNTLFSVGNGTANNARHNAFEIRQNGDIYLSSGGTDIKLQDYLGGGSDINVVQTTGTSTTDVMSQDAVTTQLGRFVTVTSDQAISGRKVFTYSASGTKAIEFKQTSDSAKVGFGIKNSAATNNELATFELRPNTFTVDNVQHPLLYLGHYRNTNTANAGVPQTVLGFRQYDQKNAAAYHYLMPLPEKAKTPFSLTTSFKDYYAPIGFKNGSTMITADDTGVVDLSSELGGLKLKKLTQAEYDALSPDYDSNTLYIIVN